MHLPVVVLLSRVQRFGSLSVAVSECGTPNLPKNHGENHGENDEK